METVTVIPSVGSEHVATFEQGFRDQGLPIWQDLDAMAFGGETILNVAG